MESILNIVTPALKPMFTTLARVKSELKIDAATTDDDDLLNSKIEEASADIRIAIGYGVASEVVTETFWHDHPQRYAYGYGWTTEGRNNEVLFLRRTPVSVVGSVTLDDVVIDASLYRLDGENGRLFCLDSSGYPSQWCFNKSLIIAYTGGYVLPGVAGSNLPSTIESATIELLTSFWLSLGRDPSIKSVNINIPEMEDRRVDYWVGATGDPDQLPPRVQQKLALIRRPRMAVA